MKRLFVPVLAMMIALFVGGFVAIVYILLVED